MGAWGDGPFGNDTAADWCGDLDDADPTARAELIRAALETAASNEGYLDHDDAAPAVAAAAIIASSMPGGSLITSTHAPDFLLAGQTLDFGEDLREMAVRALDRILGDDSEWRELWSDAGAQEFPEIERLRAVLSGPPEIPGQMALL